MGKYIVVFLILTAILSSKIELVAIDFQIEKVNDFSITSSRSSGLFWKHSIIADYPYLYALSDYGLEVYSIENDGSLSLITRKPVVNSNTMIKIDGFIYIGTRKNHYNPFNAMIVKIDVTNPLYPSTVQIKELTDDVSSVDTIFYDNDHLLINTWTYPLSYSYPILNLDLEIAEEYIAFNGLLRAQINDSLVLVEYDAFSYLVYDLSDIANVTVVGSGDTSQAHTVYQEFYYDIYQDTVLVIGGQREMSFWDISDPSDWQLLHNITYIQDPSLVNYGWAFHIKGNYLFYLHDYNLIVIDLEDFTYHQILELEPYPYAHGVDAAYWGNYIYVTTPESGIQRFSCYDGVFSRVEIIGEYFSNQRVSMNDNYIISGSNYNKHGTIIFDISDPFQIEEINRIKENIPHMFHMAQDDLLIVREYTTLFEYASVIEIIDISDPINPNMRNTLDLSSWPQQYFWPMFDSEDPGYLYGLLCNQMKLVKFDINEPGEGVLVFEYDLPQTSDFAYQIRAGIMYFLIRHGNTNWYNVRIYSGLLNNEPQFNGTINYVGNYHLTPNVVIKDDYLTIFLWAGYYSHIEGLSLKTFFYNLAIDPLNPEFVFENEMPGRPLIVDDLIFQSPSPTIFVFDLDQHLSGVIEPFDSFLNNGWATHIFLQGANGSNFLYCVSNSCISVYEYNYELSAEDYVTDLPAGTSLARNYPNPFNPETNISFYLEQEKRVKLEIFNIRGQKLATLIDDILPEGEHSLVWSPQSHRGRDLPSGVYLYRLQAGDYAETRKMLYLK